MLRGAVIHEDNLVNHRLTWLLTAQGFTLAFFGVVQVVAHSEKTPAAVAIGLELFLACVLVFAILLCRVVGFSVAMANLHHIHLFEWWMTRYPDERRASVLPEHLPQAPPPSQRLLSWNVYKIPGWLANKCFSWLWWKWFPSRSFRFRPASADSGGICAKEPQNAFPAAYPPLRGDFRVGRWDGVGSLPMVFLNLNLLLIAVCLGLSGWKGYELTSNRHKLRVEVERGPAGVTLKTVIELDGSEHDVNAIKKAWRRLDRVVPSATK